MKGNSKKVGIAVAVFLLIAMVAQVVESKLDKEAVKSYVRSHLVEDDLDGKEERMEFEREDQQVSNIFEWIGF